MATRVYDLPKFLEGAVSLDAYKRWLDRKAVAHVRRDRKRDNLEATRQAYMRAIHSAVIRSEGRDAYTGEPLDWSLIATYDNEKSKSGRRAYKASLALLPTADHVGDGLGPADFKICSWRTNSAKNDLSQDNFVALCRLVVAYSDQEALK